MILSNGEGGGRVYTFVLAKKTDGSAECWRLAGIVAEDRLSDRSDSGEP